MNPSLARDQQFVVVIGRWPGGLQEVVRVDAGFGQGFADSRYHCVRIAPDASEVNVDIVRAFRRVSEREAEAAVDRGDALVALGAPFETERPWALPALCARPSRAGRTRWIGFVLHVALNRASANPEGTGQAVRP